MYSYLVSRAGLFPITSPLHDGTAGCPGAILYARAASVSRPRVMGSDLLGSLVMTAPSLRVDSLANRKTGSLLDDPKMDSRRPIGDTFLDDIERLSGLRRRAASSNPRQENLHVGC